VSLLGVLFSSNTGKGSNPSLQPLTDKKIIKMTQQKDQLLLVNSGGISQTISLIKSIIVLQRDLSLLEFQSS
jgi:hypothetical protein